jgi:hypothetical protein
MMHERNYTLLFNLNGYESTATESVFSLYRRAMWPRNGKKNLLDIVIMEMKNKESRNASERDPHLSRKEGGKKNVNLCC